jgi:hypothetical protein
VNTTKDIFNVKKIDPISMIWREEQVMNRDKNHTPQVHKNQRSERKLIDSRRDIKSDDRQEDSEFHSSRDRGENEVESTSIPFKRSRRLTTNRTDDFLWIGFNKK